VTGYADQPGLRDCDAILIRPGYVVQITIRNYSPALRMDLARVRVLGADERQWKSAELLLLFDTPGVELSVRLLPPGTQCAVVVPDDLSTDLHCSLGGARGQIDRGPPPSPAHGARAGRARSYSCPIEVNAGVSS
jgi:hypothetical protein